MQANLLLKASRLLGSQKALAKAIGAQPKQLNAWINMGIEIPFEYAMAIEQATDNLITAKALSPLKAKIASCSHHTLQVVELPLEQIQIHCERTNINQTEFTQSICDISQQELSRPIAVDTAYKLIFGERNLKIFQQLRKPVIACCILNLSTLLRAPEQLEAVKAQFTISERAALGIALENHIGHRHGGNRRKIQVQNSALEPGTKLRDHLADALGFGSHFTYEQAKKIYRCHMYELIQAVDNGRVAISSAIHLIDMPLAEQRIVLQCDDKSIIAAAKQSKLRHQQQGESKLF